MDLRIEPHFEETNPAAGMPCPVCRVPLVMSERQGDYCPQCRGVWLDRGELDKIIDRSTAEATPAPAPTPAPDPRYGYRPKRKKSFLEELFD